MREFNYNTIEELKGIIDTHFLNQSTRAWFIINGKEKKGIFLCKDNYKELLKKNNILFVDNTNMRAFTDNGDSIEFAETINMGDIKRLTLITK